MHSEDQEAQELADYLNRAEPEPFREVLEFAGLFLCFLTLVLLTVLL